MPRINKTRSSCRNDNVAGRAAARSPRARYACKRAVLLGIAASAVLASCSYANAEQLVAQHRQLMPSQQQPYHQHDLFRRQSNGTGDGGIGISISNTAVIPGGESSTTTLPPNQGSSSTALDPSSSSTTSATVESSTSAPTTSGDTTTSAPETSTSTSSSIPTTTEPTTTSSEPTSGTSATSQDVITTIITTTLDNGSIMTSAATATNTAESDKSNDEPTNHKAWIIPLSVVAGIVALSGFLFLGYRCTQRRFSELDDEDGNGIRWPQLMQRHDEEGTTLNPLATKRREGAGFDMDEDKSMSQMDLVGNDGLAPVRNGRGTPVSNHEVFANAGLGAPGMAMSRTASSGGSSNGGSASGNAYYGAPQNAYYDPYLGASGAPYPPPPRIASPNLHQQQQQGGYYDPYQDNPDYAPTSPYYPPPSRNAVPSGRSSPYQGAAVGSGSPHLPSPPIGAGQATMPPHPDVPGYSPNLYEENEDHYYHQNREEHLVSPGVPRALSPVAGQNQAQAPRKPMRLSIANPDGLVQD
ncbi:hypothetical protein P389DRAFT_190302 [Cystobasidium minutum MCA 4210]|uniref:uncharacterized protein n=1 Tax=Cystobasidium minutum MCA 4210 TaxID=1397322 RepID=UPI0034CD941A|eukprot:jgi/Rhomi1/190302/estExt_fgenesh1_pg.C_5_t10076